jgi:hypothetical protein
MRAAGSSCPLAHRGVASPCCAGRPLSRPLRRHDVGAKHLATRPHAVLLLPPSLLTPRVTNLASSSLAPRRIGTMRWHTHARRMALSSATLPIQLTTPTPVYRQKKTPTPRVPFTAPVAALAALRAARAHARSTTMLSRHLPLSLLAQARVAPTQCTAIKGTSPVHFVYASGFTVRRSRSTRPPRSNSWRHD